tara:strand:+ start:3455 stop:3730 length:276 start_codon:yes stop_codon:yes gene_type:complete
MAKSKKPSKAKVAKKLSEEELDNIRQLQAKIQNVVMSLGSAELAKATIVKQHSDLNSEWKSFTTDLEKKYGQVNVNLEDGTLTPLESSEDK